MIQWQICDAEDNIIASGEDACPDVPYYGRAYIQPTIVIPESLPQERIDGKLRVALLEDGNVISQNHYDIIIATPNWSIMPVMGVAEEMGIAVSNPSTATDTSITSNKQNTTFDVYHLGNESDLAQLKLAGYNYKNIPSVSDLPLSNNNKTLCIISGVNDITSSGINKLKKYVSDGGRLLILNSNELAKELFPEHIESWITPTEGDIVVMERTDHQVFDGMDELDLRYFNNEKREIPTACYTTIMADRNDNVVELASQMKIHAYIDGGDYDERLKKIESMRGLNLMEIKDGNGRAIISSMATDKAATDPIAARLISNIISYMTGQE